MRFGIRGLLLVVFLVAFPCALYVAARNSYFADRIQVNSALNDVRGISNVNLLSHIDIVEEVTGSSFSVDAHPNSMVVLGGLNGYSEGAQFSVSRIGKWTFKISGRRHLGAFKSDTGEPVESDYVGGNIQLGRDSPYKDLIPFDVNTLQDLVDHYADLVDLFDSWPRESAPGSVVLEDGSTQFFHVVEDLLPPK